jgi:hypothetical protein
MAKKPSDKSVPRVDVCEVQISHCRLPCGSTDREPYSRTFALPQAGIGPDGREYTHVVWRDTKCLKCGQHRKDKSYETRGNTENELLPGATSKKDAAD